MYGYSCLIMRNNTEYHSDDNGPYSSWRAEYENSFEHIRPSDDTTDVLCPFEIKPGEECYVVWVEWSSGDSFGSGIRSNYDVIGVFRDEISARELADTIYGRNQKETKDDDRDDYHIKCETSDGQSFNRYASWNGYFEKLEDVHIEHTIVQ